MTGLIRPDHNPGRPHPLPSQTAIYGGNDGHALNFPDRPRRQAEIHRSGQRIRTYFMSIIRTSAPFRRLLSSAAVMKVKISMVSSGFTGAIPVWKNLTISTTSGA